jgi:predicted secreted protein
MPMRSLTLVLLCAGLFALMLVSHVATGDGDAPQVMVNDQGVWYRADIQANKDTFGHTIQATKGSLVDVSLAENASTGYSWRCTWEPTEGVALVRSAYARPAGSMMGAGGTRHFLLLVSQPGKTTVTLQYGRWWDGGDRKEPQSFTIEAKADSKVLAPG